MRLPEAHGNGLGSVFLTIAMRWAMFAIPLFLLGRWATSGTTGFDAATIAAGLFIAFLTLD